MDKILEGLYEEKNEETSRRLIWNYLDSELAEVDTDIEKIANFFLKLKTILEEKKMLEELELIENIYLLDENNMLKLVNSTNSKFLFLLRQFYAKSSFYDFYLIVLKKIKDIVTKNNLLFLLSEEFNEISFQIKNYIQYLKDGNEYIEFEEEELLEYEIFREIFSPYVKKNLENVEEDKINKILSFFEKMAISPDDYVWILLRDIVIEGGWLEGGDNFEDIIKKFEDNFLKLYALVYDGRVFIRNEKIWAEVKRRGMKI